MIQDDPTQIEYETMSASSTVSVVDGGSTKTKPRGNESLLEAISLLATLSTMSSEQYKVTLNGSFSDSMSTTVPVLQARLDRVVQDTHLGTTDVPRLAQSLHQWQSFAIESATESEKLNQEVQMLCQQLEQSHARVVQLESAVQKLHGKNHKLKEKLRTKQSEKKSLLNSVKDYLRQARKNEDDIDQRVITQLHSHERIMRLEATLRREEGNRSRTSSRESCFSDDGIYGLDHDDSRSVVSSISSMSTTTVTDEGVASLSIAPSRNKENKEKKDIQLVFEPKSRIGIQFVKVAVEEPKKGMLDDQLMTDEKRTKPSFPVSFAFPGRGKEEFLFLVCGRHGFEEGSPSLGDCLVAVNDRDDFNEGDIVGETVKSTRLVFRRHRMSSKQSAIVAKAAAFVESRAIKRGKLEVIEVPRELPNFSSFIPFQQQPLKQDDKQQEIVGSVSLSNVGDDNKNIGAQTSEKLGSAMRAMGRPFKFY